MVHQDITLTVKREREYRHNPYGKKGYGHTQSLYGGLARPSQTSGAGTDRDPHPTGRDPHPLGHQPIHQEEWASVKETSHTQRKHPLH